MSLKTATIKVGATDRVAKSTGVSTSLVLLDDSARSVSAQLPGATFVDSIGIEFKKSEATRQSSSPDGYSQRRAQMIVKIPRLLTNGTYTTDTIRVEIARSVEATEGDVDEMLSLSSQLIDSADVMEFYRKLSLQ